MIIGLAAFVTEDVNAFVWIYQKRAFIFGGLIIPLNFYPPWLQLIARALPFSAIVYLPSHLFVAPSLAALYSTLAFQCIWIIMIGLLTVLAYRKGAANLAVNGG